MSDFNTIPAQPIPEKPQGDEEKKEDIKPSVEPVDWDSEPAAPEPDFVSERDVATRIYDAPLRSEDINEEPRRVDPDPFDRPQRVDPDPFDRQQPVEPDPFASPRRVEPEVIDSPAYQPPPPGGTPPAAGLPPKKNRTLLIVLGVLLLLCLCCVGIIVIGGMLFPTDMETFFNF